MTANSVRPLDELLSLLSNVAITGDGKWKSNCPIHEDDGQQHDPSLQITETVDGTVLIYCHVCKDSSIGPRICTKFGLPIRKLFPDWGRTATSAAKNKKKRNLGKKTAEYEYRDIDGVVVYKSTRYEKPDGGKEFVLSRPNGRGGWINSIKGITRIPYRLPELIATPVGQVIYIVEGEKKVDALAKWNQAATCNAGGAGKWLKEWSTYFRGRRVVILPDNDPANPETGRRPGQDHAVKVLECLKPVAEIVRILELPDLPPKGDIVDWQAAGRTLAELQSLTDAVLTGPEKEQPSPPPAPAIDNPLSIVFFNARTDIANGQRLVKKHGHEIRYCQPMGKWLIWTGQHWAIDQIHAIDRMVIGCTLDAWSETAAFKASGTIPMTVDKMEKFCQYSDSIQGLTRTVRAAQTERAMQVLPKNLDSDPWVLNVENGTIDLQSGDLLPHDPEKLLTKISRIKFDAEATCPIWERFVRSVFRGDVEVIGYIKRLCGYWATGLIREQILPIFWGSGSNGKTTFLNVILEVLGLDYAIKAPQDFLMMKHGDSHPTEKADLFGRRFVACSETEEGRKLSEGLVKELTGKERVRARRMREDFWEFDPTHKVILLTNHRPVISGSDHGIWRRIRLIEFGVQFWDSSKGEDGPPDLRQDKELDDKLRLEYPGILRWIVDGCQLWQHEEELLPMSVEEQTVEYRESQDTIGQWIEERCELNIESRQLVSDLYQDYREWVIKMGEHPINRKKFSMALADKGFKKIKNNVIFFVGLDLLNVSVM